MGRFERQCRVAAPLADAWEFHATLDGLRALTPRWVHLRIDAVVGPGDDSDPPTLAPGTRIDLSVRPFGVGPRRRWRSEITLRECHDGSARFRNVMRDGPFDRWEHTHSFYADGDETVLRDRVVYEPPLGAVGDATTPLLLEWFFRDRHRRAREQFVP